MQIQIQLSEQAVFWGIPNKFYLTSAEPGPLSVDFSLLDKNEQRQLILSIRQREVELVTGGSVDDLIQVYQSGGAKQQQPFRPQNVPVAQQTCVQKAIVTPVVPSDDNHVKGVLRRPLAQLKRIIMDSDDIRFLRTMLELECGGKKRKRLVELLHAKIHSLAERIQKAIMLSEKSAPASLPRIVNENDPFVSEITETEQEEVVIKVGVE